LIEVVRDDGQEIAMIVRAGCLDQRVAFFTPQHFPLQFGLLKYAKGASAPAHTHPDVSRLITKSQEIIHVEKGKARIDIFGSKGQLCASKVLSAGDSALFTAGWRGWTALEETEILEIKQGPFVEGDKMILGK